MCVVLDNADLCLAHIHGYCVEEPDGVLLFPSRDVLFSALTSICDELMIDLHTHTLDRLRKTLWKSQLRRRKRNYDSTALMQLMSVANGRSELLTDRELVQYSHALGIYMFTLAAVDATAEDRAMSIVGFDDSGAAHADREKVQVLCFHVVGKTLCVFICFGNAHIPTHPLTATYPLAATHPLSATYPLAATYLFTGCYISTGC